MILYLSAKTNTEDLTIDFISLKMENGTILKVDWDESDISRKKDGFEARYKDVYFNDEYANGKSELISNATVENIQIYTEESKIVELSIVSMIFSDDDASIDCGAFILPTIIKN